VKNTILAAAAVLTLALSAGTGFAAERNGNGNATNDSSSSSNVYNNCASILASPEGHAQADVQYCQAQQ